MSDGERAPSGGYRGERGPGRDRWATVEALEGVEGLAQELTGLIDASVRSALRARTRVERCIAIHDPRTPAAIEILSSAAAMLEDSAALAHAAMQGATLPIGSPALSGVSPITVGQAVAHAADVLRPAADEHRISIRSELSVPAASAAAGPMYLVVLAVVKNAVEAVMRGPGVGGVVDISAWTEDIDITTGERKRMVVIEVRDDGEGVRDANVFELGRVHRAGKPAASLAVCKAIVESLRGSADLRRREGRGAIMRLSFPVLNTSGGVKTGA